LLLLLCLYVVFLCIRCEILWRARE
jgi:hypothetical protein